jgi:hypothetical protein
MCRGKESLLPDSTKTQTSTQTPTKTQTPTQTRKQQLLNFESWTFFVVGVYGWVKRWGFAVGGCRLGWGLVWRPGIEIRHGKVLRPINKLKVCRTFNTP